MNVNRSLLILCIGFVALSAQALSCESTPESQPSPSESSPPSQQTPEVEIEAEEIFPTVDLTSLPLLSNAEVESLQTNLTQAIDTWFGLAGLDKVPQPPPLTNELQNYRDAWTSLHPDVAPFLGQWNNDEAYPYFVSIFPSQTAGEVCVLEFKPEWSLDIFNEVTGEYGKDVISEQILRFSVATVQDGQLRSSQVRSIDSAIKTANYAGGEAYSVLFMSVMDAQNVSRVVALSSPPALPSELPPSLVAPVSQTLNNYGCITDLMPPES